MRNAFSTMNNMNSIPFRRYAGSGYEIITLEAGIGLLVIETIHEHVEVVALPETDL